MFVCISAKFFDELLCFFWGKLISPCKSKTFWIIQLVNCSNFFKLTFVFVEFKAVTDFFLETLFTEKLKK